MDADFQHPPEYIKEIINFPIIDYSPLNINFLKNRGASNIFKFNSVIYYFFVNTII